MGGRSEINYYALVEEGRKIGHYIVASSLIRRPFICVLYEIHFVIVMNQRLCLYLFSSVSLIMRW